MLRPRPVPFVTVLAARLRFRRRSALFVAAAVVVVTVSTVVTLDARSARAELHQRWGAPVSVARARADLPLGTVITDADLTFTTIPGRLAPPSALGREAIGRTATRAIHVGEFVTGRRAPATDESGLAAVLGTNRRAVAVPIGATPIALDIGDRVDVLATDDPLVVSGRDAPTHEVARRAQVLAVGEDALTIAVTRPEATAVASALARATVTVALAPGALPGERPGT